MVAKRQEVEESARHWFRGIVLSIIEGEESFRLPDVTREALKLAGKHKARYRQFVEDIVYRAAYDVVQETVGESRQAHGLKVVRGAAFTEEAAVKGFASKFLSWTIHAGDRMFTIGTGTREDIICAADEYQEGGKELLRRARFLRSIADGLEGGQTTEERYTEEELQTLWEQAEQEGSA